MEFDGAYARLLGDEGRGVKTILEMVSHTRLDCVMGSSALMRQAVAQATHHAAHRKAFGKLLSEQPLMQNVLADLAIESEAATLLLLRLARAYDAAPYHPGERAFARVATAIGKYWVCKRAVAVVGEALECLGGAGYVEESILPRLYREAPVNSVWEGSGNVMCLDVLRALGRDEAAAPTIVSELRAARGHSGELDELVESLTNELSTPSKLTESNARSIVERLALALQGSLLVQHGDPAVSAGFVRSRLAREHGAAFGTLPHGVALAAIVERARPQVSA